ncbi:hypothetical protein D6833_05960 [Candidatus Parcubacteria bacterium]|nr:MAG: hypothetical protein D6833_05960 [Candidatus Parcubacteria bacterium]
MANVYNLYLQIGAQHGLVALLALGMFLYATLRAFREVLSADRVRETSLGMALGILGFLVVGLGESILGNQMGYWVWFFLLIANRYFLLPAAD